ncbi:hypothetical protein D3C78_1339180 [compost metagenome]
MDLRNGHPYAYRRAKISRADHALGGWCARQIPGLSRRAAHSFAQQRVHLLSALSTWL